MNNKKQELINFENHDLITMTFGEFIVLQKAGKLDLNHPTQRHTIWGPKEANKMIESIMHNFPFQPIYLVKNKSGYSVIDGKQRLSTIFLFLGWTEQELGIKIKVKKKSSDDPMVSSFPLEEKHLDEETWDYLNNLKNEEENKDETINYKFLIKKIDDFYKQIANFKFPVYILNEENKECGKEKNSNELFIRLNSSGEPILSGERYYAKVLNKLNNKQYQWEEMVKSIKEFAESICGDKNTFTRKKEWVVFMKLIWNIKKCDKLISGDFDSNVIENEIEECVDNISGEELIKYLETLKKSIELISNIKKEMIGNDNKFKSIFSKKNTNAEPNNALLFSVYIGTYFALKEENIQHKEIMKRIKNAIIMIKKILFETENAFWQIAKNDELEYKHISKTFTRETQKTKLYNFIGLEVIKKGIYEEKNIRDNIYETFFKDKIDSWAFKE